MRRYVIARSRAEADRAEGEIVTYDRIAARIDELSGRPGIAGYILGPRGPVQRVGGAFVQARRDSPWREAYPSAQGFHVRPVRRSEVGA
jgi:hypothetical protein